jgi:hypothetical protein
MLITCRGFGAVMYPEPVIPSPPWNFVPPRVPISAHQVDPLGVAPDRVRLSWWLEGAGTGRVQRAYQVRVTEDEMEAVTWDSGRVESAVTADIAYGGESSGGHGPAAASGKASRVVPPEPAEPPR